MPMMRGALHHYQVMLAAHSSLLFLFLHSIFFLFLPHHHLLQPFTISVCQKSPSHLVSSASLTLSPPPPRYLATFHYYCVPTITLISCPFSLTHSLVPPPPPPPFPIFSPPLSSLTAWKLGWWWPMMRTTRGATCWSTKPRDSRAPVSWSPTTTPQSSLCSTTTMYVLLHSIALYDPIAGSCFFLIG